MVNPYWKSHYEEPIIITPDRIRLFQQCPKRASIETSLSYTNQIRLDASIIKNCLSFYTENEELSFRDAKTILNRTVSQWKKEFPEVINLAVSLEVLYQWYYEVFVACGSGTKYFIDVNVPGIKIKDCGNGVFADRVPIVVVSITGSVSVIDFVSESETESYLIAPKNDPKALSRIWSYNISYPRGTISNYIRLFIKPNNAKIVEVINWKVKNDLLPTENIKWCFRGIAKGINYCSCGKCI